MIKTETLEIAAKELNPEPKRWHVFSINERKRSHYKFDGRLFYRRFFADSPSRKLRSSMELLLPTTSCAFSFSINDGDYSTRLHVAVPFLFSVYVSISTPWLSKIVNKLLPKNPKYSFDAKCSPWETGFYFHDWSLVIQPWVPSFCGYGKSHPWWIRSHHFNILDILFGRMECVQQVLSEWKPIVIPMAEGSYTGMYRFEKRVWKRSRLPFNSHKREYTEFKADSPILCPGKGENSWDCGMDGLMGCSSDGHDAPKLVGHVVETVMKDRERRTGTPFWIPTPEEMNNENRIECPDSQVDNSGVNYLQGQVCQRQGHSGTSVRDSSI